MIVLHTTRYGDTSLIIHAYTAESGRESFLLRGAGGGSSGKSRRHATGLLHPLCILDYVASGRPGSSMRYLKEFTPKIRTDSLRSDIRKSGMALFISELLYKSLLGGEHDGTMYAFLEDAVTRLEKAPDSCPNFHLWFLLRYAEVLGFGIHTENSGYAPFSGSQMELLGKLNRIPYDKMLSLPLTGTVRSELATALISYIGYHLGISVNILSLSVLHDVFAR